ncbi:MAG: formylglycine-generating enzyme family protein [Magnetococcales bacterium]|nr:formylglycine-generating enzyme family protein [Magnetococcales bacterium]
MIDRTCHPLIKGYPPLWASGWGQDSYGMFVEFTIGDVTQRMRWIPPGYFTMGSLEDEPGRYDDEGPQHKVTIHSGFWLADTPCTQALWQAVMGQNPSRFQTPDRPVETVSFEDVQEFFKQTEALSPGLQLFLPSEAQWEYACRADTTTAIYTGEIQIYGKNNAPVLDPIAWYGGNSGKDFDLENGRGSSSWLEKQYPHIRAGTRRVRLKGPNPWGLYDMLGNVWEWCTDHWHDSYIGAPADGQVWVNPNDARRILRGGSWHYYARNVRAAYRFKRESTNRDAFSGFRCARVL